MLQTAEKACKDPSKDKTQLLRRHKWFGKKVQRSKMWPRWSITGTVHSRMYVYMCGGAHIEKWGLLTLIYYFLCVCVVFLNVCKLCVQHAYRSLWKAEGGIRSATGVLNDCVLPCGCWELNLGPLQEESLFLTSKPSLQLLCFWS